MDHFEIKIASIKDVNQLQKIGRQTFIETFSGSNTEANMTQYLTKGFSVEKLTAELENKNSQFYFAVLESKVIGYLKLNFGESQTEIKDNNALEIERIYILQEYQGKHAGQILYEKAIAIALEKKLNFIWLGVWEQNLRAINFYKKNGFIEFDMHIFTLGDDEQTDILMKLQL